MRQLFTTLIVWLLLIAMEQPAAAANLTRGEVAVKATFMVKFTSYIDWPSSTLQTGQPIIFCVIGADQFSEVLDNAALQQQNRGRQIVVRRVSSQQINACHIAYLGGSAGDLTQTLSATRGRPIVTITDSRISPSKGTIHFQVAAGKVRFDINASAAKLSGLTVSSHLLGLARVVK